MRKWQTLYPLVKISQASLPRVRRFFFE
jgi:hypothetical protein